jgi:peptidoglycan/LPS O-acetylase OafA/YrhL
MSSTKDVSSLTAFRGLLALWVVVGHFWVPVTTLVPALGFLDPVASRGQLAVPAFFALSGWVLSLNYAERFRMLDLRSFADFLALRLARVYPVHFATLLAVAATFAASMATGRAPGHPQGYSPTDFVLNLLLAQAWVAFPVHSWNYPAWSISAEWFGYLLFPGSIHLLHRAGSRSVVAPLLLLGGIVSVAGLVFFGSRWPFYPLLLVVAGFASGIGIHWSNLSPTARAPWKWWPELLVVLTFSLAWFHDPRPFFLLLCVAPTLIILVLSRLGDRCSPLWTHRAVLLLGEVSYSLYLVHAVVARFALQALPPARWGQRGALVGGAVVVAYALAVALATWACYALVERPSRRWIRERVGRRRG